SGQDRFPDLPNQATLRSEKKGFRHLLGDRASSLNDLSRAKIGDARPENRHWANPLMFKKTIVLRRNKSLNDDIGDFIKRNQISPLFEKFPNQFLVVIF